MATNEELLAAAERMKTKWTSTSTWWLPHDPLACRVDIDYVRDLSILADHAIQQLTPPPDVDTELVRAAESLAKCIPPYAAHEGIYTNMDEMAADACRVAFAFLSLLQRRGPAVDAASATEADLRAAIEAAIVASQPYMIDDEASNILKHQLTIRILPLLRSRGLADDGEPWPGYKWADLNEIRDWLLGLNYAPQIADELAPQIVETYNGAFRKGLEIGRRQRVREDDEAWDKFCHDHLPPSRLFRIVMMDDGTDTDRKHLLECKRCQRWAEQYRADALGVPLNENAGGKGEQQ